MGWIKKKMKKGILQIFLGNIIFLVFGILNNFFLPKYLSIDSYAQVKTYILYVGYAGLLGLGYTEGMFLKYGGKNIAEAKQLGFRDNFVTYFWFQCVLSAMLLLFSMLINSLTIFAVSIGIFTTNIVNYFKNFCTASGEFKLYSIAISIEKILIFLLNVMCLFFFKLDNYIFYIGVLILVMVLEIIYFNVSLNYCQCNIFKGKFNVNEIVSCIQSGIILLLGNSMSAVFTGIDQWFIKLLMSNFEFAIYSFSVSMERIINLFLTPITTVLYNFFSRQKNQTAKTEFVQELIALWAFATLIVVFFLKGIIYSFIYNYLEAIDIISILFCGQALSCIINGVYINIMKVNKQQSIFLKQMILMCILSIIFNIIGFHTIGTMQAIALATLVTKIVWLIICQVECKDNRYSLRASIGIFSLIIGFLYCSHLTNIFYGGFVYFILIFAISILFMRRTFFQAIRETSHFIKDLKNMYSI